MDANTFDITDLFSGNSLPSEEIAVYVDEQANYELAKAEKEAAKDPQNSELEARREEALERARAARFVVRLSAVPRHDIVNIVRDVDESHPEEVNAFGRAKPNPERQEALSDSLWALHLKEIESPSGAKITEFSPEDVRSLRTDTPHPVAEAIDKAIGDLSDLSKKGYETAAMETDFLSKR